MTDTSSPGARFRAAVEANNPLQVVGAVNAYFAIMAEKTGHQALYLSGGGVAANAPNRDNAILFLEYLASDQAQEYFSAGNDEYPGVPARAHRS